MLSEELYARLSNGFAEYWYPPDDDVGTDWQKDQNQMKDISGLLDKAGVPCPEGADLVDRITYLVQLLH